MASTCTAKYPSIFADAALGGDLEVPTLSGRVKLSIPEGTQTGKMFRLRGKGIKPVRGGSVGDLLCKVVVETPVGLSKEQKDLLDQFRESTTGKSTSPNPAVGLTALKAFSTIFR